MVKAVKYDWTEHRFFKGAPDILEKAELIDRIHASSGPNASSWNPAECERELFALFGGKLPHWPAFDAWANDRVSRGIDDTVFGPLTIPSQPVDFWMHATAATIRAAGKAAGVRKMGRSKGEIISAVKPFLSEDALSSLRGEGFARWDRFELQPAIMTRFRVLHSTIAAILCTARYLDVLLQIGEGDAVWLSAQDSTTCSECRALEATKAQPAIELQNGLLNLPPRHPGCRCTVVSTL